MPVASVLRASPSRQRASEGGGAEGRGQREPRTVTTHWKLLRGWVRRLDTCSGRLGGEARETGGGQVRAALGRRLAMGEAQTGCSLSPASPALAATPRALKRSPIPTGACGRCAAGDGRHPCAANAASVHPGRSMHTRQRQVWPGVARCDSWGISSRKSGRQAGRLPRCADGSRSSHAAGTRLGSAWITPSKGSPACRKLRAGGGKAVGQRLGAERFSRTAFGSAASFLLRQCSRRAASRQRRGEPPAGGMAQHRGWRSGGSTGATLRLLRALAVAAVAAAATTVAVHADLLEESMRNIYEDKARCRHAPCPCMLACLQNAWLPDCLSCLIAYTCLDCWLAGWLAACPSVRVDAHRGHVWTTGQGAPHRTHPATCACQLTYLLPC
eukprot:365545-Chlamydomonas_euryale.AAC.1